MNAYGEAIKKTVSSTRAEEVQQELDVVQQELDVVRSHRLCLRTWSISGLVVEYVVAIDVTRVRFPADALRFFPQVGLSSVQDRSPDPIGQKKLPLIGFEPTIFASGGRRLIH